MGVLVKNVSITPVTGSFTSFRSEGNRLPICACNETAGRNNAKEDANKKFFIFIQQDDLEAIKNEQVKPGWVACSFKYIRSIFSNRPAVAGTYNTILFRGCMAPGISDAHTPSLHFTVQNAHFTKHFAHLPIPSLETAC